MIIGHQNLVDRQLTNWIFSFHMPLFFIISGILHKSKPFKVTLLHTVKTLLIPFFLINVIWILYYLAAYLKNGISISHLNQYIIGSFISPGKEFFIFRPLCIYTWFLLALAWIKLLTVFVDKNILVILISLIISTYIKTQNIVLPLAIDSTILAISFYLLGYLLSQYLKKTYSVLYNIFGFVIALILLLLVFSINGPLDINMSKYGANILLAIASGLLGTVMVFCAAKIIENIINRLPALLKFINIISCGTVLIVGFSAMFSSFVRGILMCVCPVFMYGTNQLGIVVGIVTLLCFYPIIILTKKIFPAIIGFRR